MSLMSLEHGYFLSNGLSFNTLRILCVSFLVSVLSACNVTIQSSQYSFIKSFFAEKTPAFEKNWQVRWDNKIHYVYAINHEAGTFFADEEGFLLKFDGWQITELALPNSMGQIIAVVEPKRSKDGSMTLQYFNGEREKLSQDLCRPWQPMSQGPNVLEWRQECEGRGSTYTNKILLDDLGRLVSLRFALLPTVEPIEIEVR